jgi:hypothetical protein
MRYTLPACCASTTIGAKMATARTTASPIRRMAQREPGENASRRSVNAMALAVPNGAAPLGSSRAKLKVLAPETGERPSRIFDEVSQRRNRNGARFDGDEARRVEI